MKSAIPIKSDRDLFRLWSTWKRTKMFFDLLTFGFNFQTIELFYGSSVFMFELDSKTTLALAVHERSLRVSLPPGGEEHLEIPGEFLHTWSMWRAGQLAVGGLLGEMGTDRNHLALA